MTQRGLSDKWLAKQKLQVKVVTERVKCLVGSKSILTDQVKVVTERVKWEVGSKIITDQVKVITERVKC